MLAIQHSTYMQQNQKGVGEGKSKNQRERGKKNVRMNWGGEVYNQKKPVRQ